MSAADSQAVFLARMTELGLIDLKPIFVANGWMTFNDFAFSCSDPTGKDTEIFKKEVLDVLITGEATKPLVPRVRRLYTQSYVIGAAEMERFGNPSAVDEKVAMHPADRTTRTEAIRAKLTGFTLSGPSVPSFALIDRFATIMAKGAVRYVPWEKCTSREQELIEQPEVKGLRLNEKGMLVQDIAPDPNTSLSGELLWEYALRRRAIAGEIAGLIQFDTTNLWHDILKSALLSTPPPGHRAVTYAQLRAADLKVFSLVSEECNDGTICKPGETTSEFEKAFKKMIYDIGVRMLLQPLPGSSTPSPSGGTARAAPPIDDAEPPSAKMRKLENRLRNTEEQLRAARRRLESAADAKGSGKQRRGKGDRKGDRGGSAPEGLRNKCTRLPSGEPICFSFNLGGCNAAKPGQRCPRGWHVCAEPGCGGSHSLAQHS